MEVWVYMQVEMTIGRVPWKEIQDINKVGEYKKRCRFAPGIDELFPPPCPPEYRYFLPFSLNSSTSPFPFLPLNSSTSSYRECMAIADKTDYFDQPDYNTCYTVLVHQLPN